MGKEILNKKQRLAKNKQIKKTMKETITRHEKMVCKTYELKVDRSHLSITTLETLRLLFLEAKWFYNNLIAMGDIWHADYKITLVRVRNKDKSFEPRELKHLSAQMRQEIIGRAKDSIVGLSVQKMNGRKVGVLKFKKRVLSIPLKQYGGTHRLEGNRVSIQNVKQSLRVRGANQIPKGVELTTATLEQRSGDYFIHITTYHIPDKKVKKFSMKEISLDAGIDKPLTLSNGIDIKEGVSITKRAKRLHRELSNRSKLVDGKHTRNWFKTNQKLNKEYDRICHKRTDIKNKIVSRITTTADMVHVQDDNVAGWQMMWGRRVTTSAIGGIMSALKKRAHTPIVVGQWARTTGTCHQCGNEQKVGLEERIFECEKGCPKIDRNFNSTFCIGQAKEDGEGRWRIIPAVRRESTPVDIKTSIGMLQYLNSISGVSASPVVETGSHPTLVGG